MKLNFLTWLFSLALSPILCQSIELKGGNYFNGKKFKHIKNYYIKDGKFTKQRPTKIDSSIDLSGLFIVPPFSEAHTHMLSSEFEAKTSAARYLKEGIFYVQVLGNNSEQANLLRNNFNKPSTIDVIYAQGGITSTFGHPFLLYESLAMGIFSREDRNERIEEIRVSRRMEGKSYWLFDSMEDVETKWPLYLASKPDVVKIFLLNSEKYEEVKQDGRLGNKGLHPDIAREVTKRAHAVGLRVYAHIESVHDLKTAIDIGVNGLAHLPDYRSTCKEESCKLKRSDLRKLKPSAIAITPTLALSLDYIDSTRQSALKTEQRRIIQICRKKMTLLIGSDMYGKTALTEALYWASLNALSNAELLRIWCEASATLFPNRKIGKIREGYEASFLGLTQNPLRDFSNVTKISICVKAGVLLGSSKVGQPQSN